MQENLSNEIEDGSLSVKEFVELYGKKAKGVLVPYAAKIFVMAPYGGVPVATEYINSKLGTEFSKKPVTDLMDKIKEGEIILTAHEILEAAKEDPRTAAFFQRKLHSMDSASPVDADFLARLNPRMRGSTVSPRQENKLPTSPQGGGKLFIDEAEQEEQGALLAELKSGR